MSEKKNEVIIPEYIPPPGPGRAPAPGGKLWDEITASWGQRSRPPRVEPESELQRAARTIREGREKIRASKIRRSEPDPVSGSIKNQANPLLGGDLENHFRKLLNLGVDLAEGKLRELFGQKKK